jgi:hypothetical protein
MVSARDHPSVQLQAANANDNALELEQTAAGEALLSSHITPAMAATPAMVPAQPPPTPLQAVIAGGGALMLDKGMGESSLSSQIATTEGAWPKRIPPALCISLLVALFPSSVFLIGRSGVRQELHPVVGLPTVENQGKLTIGLSEQLLLDGWTPTKISWATQSDKCWKVGAKPGEYRNGMKLMLWDCIKSDEFILPPGGEGPIRPASASEFCLDAPPGSNDLQFWLCSAAPARNTRWSLPEKGKLGFFKAVADPTKCIDVPEGIPDNGRELIRWSCKEHQMDMIFQVNWPYDCSWAPWSEWSPCSTHCRTWRSRQEQNQLKTLGTVNPGNACTGTEEEVKGCTWGFCAAEGSELVTGA